MNIGYVGRLSAGKRFQDLIAAMGILGLQCGSDALPLRLKVAGSFVDATFEKQIQQQVQQLLNHGHLQPDSVQFLGHLASLNTFWPTIDALVLPSLNEPFGRVLIEAMANNVLCIGTDSGGIPEILAPDCGFLFPPQTPLALAHVLQRVLQLGKTERVTILQNARRRVQERFTIPVQVKHLMDLYAECLS